MFIVGVPDKATMKWLKKKKYITATDEGEAIGIAGGYYLATGKKATVFMSADGFCNALNPITSWVLSDKVKMDLIISSGRQEKQHRVMSTILRDIIKLLEYENPKTISFKIIE